MSAGPVAVLDVGSNTIKILVATRAPGGGLQLLATRTVEARIAAGISQAQPALGKAEMVRGLEAIRSLLTDVEPFHCAQVILVATSAVRDARNGAEFAARVQAETGQPLRILSGREEAIAVGRGLTTDPALRTLHDFQVFDLGGGSLEFLAFRHRQPEQAISLPLGCVRLTESFLPDPSEPFPPAVARQVAEHTRAVLTQAGYPFALPAGTPAVGTGGTVTTVRAIRAAREGCDFAATDPVVSISELRGLLAQVGPLTLAQRRRIPGLPPARADVFPTALATLLAIAELGRFPEYRHSTYTLRHGLAAAALGAN